MENYYYHEDSDSVYELSNGCFKFIPVSQMDPQIRSYESFQILAADGKIHNFRNFEPVSNTRSSEPVPNSDQVLNPLDLLIFN